MAARKTNKTKDQLSQVGFAQAPFGDVNEEHEFVENSKQLFISPFFWEKGRGKSIHTSMI